VSRRPSSVGRRAWSVVTAGRGAWWALRAVRHVRSRHLRVGVDPIVVPHPPLLGPAARRGIELVLRGSSASCLERAVVVQRWRASQGQVCAIVIGVTAPGAGFRAHAWLEDEPAPGFGEITRFTP
jgi:hypothetical protein